MQTYQRYQPQYLNGAMYDASVNSLVEQGYSFANKPAPAMAIALELTALWLLSRDAVFQVLIGDPALGLLLQRSHRVSSKI